MTMSRDVASEHLQDGVDCIKDCLRTISRVRKSFPLIDVELADTVTHLKAASDSLKGAETALQLQAAKPK